MITPTQAAATKADLIRQLDAIKRQIATRPTDTHLLTRLADLEARVRGLEIMLENFDSGEYQRQRQEATNRYHELTAEIHQHRAAIAALEAAITDHQAAIADIKEQVKPHQEAAQLAEGRKGNLWRKMTDLGFSPEEIAALEQ